MTSEAPQYSMLSVIVPVNNERNTVGEVVRRIRNFDLPDGLDLEVIVVDDGSNDGTDKVLATLEDSTVRVVRHASRKGLGAAIRTGLSEARGDVLILQDPDLEYSADDLPRLVAPILKGKAKVVYGSRFHPERESMSLTSLLADRGVSVATCFLYNTTLTDVETGLKAFDRKTIEAINIVADDNEVGAEITGKLLRSGQRIFEVPVTYSSNKKNSGSKDRVTALKTLVRNRFGSVQ